MKHPAMFCEIDLLSAEHLLSPSFDVCRTGEIEKEGHRLLGDSVLREIDEEIIPLERELLKSTGVGFEQIPHLERLDIALMGLKSLPGGRIGQ